MTKPRLNLADAVDDLAPPPPPCFHNRAGWLAYLKSAAAAQNHAGEPKVIVIASDQSAAFNFAFPFCADCTQVKSFDMDKQGRCNKDYLAQLQEKAS